MTISFDPDFDPATGKIIDFLSGQLLEALPEERVRQTYLKVLHFDYGYPKSVMRREVTILAGANPVVGVDGSPTRADIAVYLSARDATLDNQGRIKFVVECKRPDVTSGRNQLVSYIFNTSAGGGVWYNGDDLQAFRRRTQPENELEVSPKVPSVDETWDAVGRAPKSDLRRPRDVRGLLRVCNNKLHGRGIDGDEEDLTMDMVRIILAKAQDETESGEYPLFYVTSDEYSSSDGRASVAARVQALFRRYADNYPAVFDAHEVIKVSDSAITEVVAVLQEWRVMTRLDDAAEWDIMGSAYEQYTAVNLKRARGQFFTNRLIVDFVVGALDPGGDVRALDPAGGSGGFVTAVLRHVRRKILAETESNPTGREHQLANLRQRLSLVEISPRLVKIAKTAMLLNGDGHAGMTRGDSLGPYENFDAWIQEKANRGQPNLIVTNPPFAGVGEGQISDPEVLDQFALARRWSADESGVLNPNMSSALEHRPPEMLFFERCLDWLKPGGKLGIVMPKSFLDTSTYRNAREMLFSSGQLLGVVTFHKNSFQPDTGVRTCVVLVRKYEPGEVPAGDYPIFMGISQKIGRDSEGRSIFKVGPNGETTDEIDHDLDELLSAFVDLHTGTLIPSEYRFSIDRAALPTDTLNINPQYHLPHLNETLRMVQQLDDSPEWDVLTLAQVEQGIRIFKGPRLRTDNIIVDRPGLQGDSIEPYFTPSALLQDKRESVKWIDLSRASARQLAAFEAVRVRTGDLLVTRSGTIGRIAYISSSLDGAIVSDDAIRVRVSDPELRAYVFSFLQSRAAQEQMRINEYGAVQQHLEPEHVRDLLIPVPTDWRSVVDVVTSAKKFFASKETQDFSMEMILSSLETLYSTPPMPTAQ
ncbi:type I restriction enzyme M protein [Microbacteriaceae bacterium SG_E_30_P1]|uniref:Type I restriction enzyme M protein n=1 Tax=Antiquaquibacter oligotrophicus TaxID=2880260 RepID=A0ABT6KJG3_9MICO|nr:N-6 DNA methylase [Antiquaquibacter oligotrophicus]MDH6180088.1 type I restriction enzyme M protein [Antiquaquibacter oligotrophicus]UDF14161.1 N-6 DNA methylase [Antiquaquibacter oligotrophicus]